MTYLVTGSAGFIGFHLAKRLLDLGHFVVGVDNFNKYYDPSLKEARNAILEKYPAYKVVRGDLSDLFFVKDVFKKYEIQKIAHLAAQAGVRYSLLNPHAYVSANLVGFVNLIEEAKNAGVRDFIYASSSSVYGNSCQTPFCVSDPVDKPISLYAATKKANELIAHTYHHLYGLNCTGLRFFTVYGPYGRPDMAIFKFTEAILKNKPIEIYNFGKLRRDFTYVDDIIDGVLKCLEKSYPCEVFNIGNNQTVELEHFINCLEKSAGRKALKRYLPMQPGDVLETWADIDYSKEKLGYNPKTKIEEGAQKFVDWYKEYYKHENTNA